MNCIAHPGVVAVADYQWYTDALRTQTASLCSECAAKLWEMLNPLLQTNRATLRIDKPGTLTEDE